MYDFSREVIERLQLVHSHEVEQLQLADLMIGAVAYLNRGLQGNAGKMAIIEPTQRRSDYSLTKTTPPRMQWTVLPLIGHKRQ